MNAEGKVVQILDEQSGVSKAGKEWSKREFVIETFDQFPKQIAFTLFGDKLELINGIKVGQVVNVHFNLESREFNGRWFHNVGAWRIDLGQEQESSEYKPVSANVPANDNFDNNSSDPTDDLPF